MLRAITTCMLISMLAVGPALADEVPAAPAPAAQEASTSWGLNVDLGFASAYVFRGFNVFQEDSQMDPNMLLAPGVTWSIFDTGLSLGYWGAFQLNGDNISANIDGALGAEQDLFLTYGYAITDSIGVSAGVTAYLYPASKKEAVGASFASFLEPVIGASYSTVVDLGLKLSYLVGLQDQPAIRGISYFYLNPTVGKEIGILDWLALDLTLGYGFKVFKEGNDGASNVHDLLLSAAAPITIWKPLYIKPGVNLAWTNIEGDDKDFADGLVVWGGLNVGVDL